MGHKVAAVTVLCGTERVGQRRPAVRTRVEQLGHADVEQGGVQHPAFPGPLGRKHRGVDLRPKRVIRGTRVALVVEPTLAIAGAVAQE